MKQPEIRESKLERQCVEYAQAAGWWTSKFVAPGMRGVPDRIFIRDGVVVFGELKRPGETPTAQQALRHKKMRAAGAVVYSWDNFDEFKRDLKSL